MNQQQEDYLKRQVDLLRFALEEMIYAYEDWIFEEVLKLSGLEIKTVEKYAFAGIDKVRAKLKLAEEKLEQYQVNK